MKAAPRIPTALVRKLCNRATIGRRVVGGVVEILGLSDPEALGYLRGILRSLREDQFVETVVMTYAEGDVYGVRNEEGDWYVKVTDTSGVTVVSCHRPMEPMTTVGGLTVGDRR